MPHIFTEPILTIPPHIPAQQLFLYSDLHNLTPTEPEIPAPISELTETVVCALGLALGLVGIIMGAIFIIQGLRSGGISRQQGPL